MYVNHFTSITHNMRMEKTFDDRYKKYDLGLFLLLLPLLQLLRFMLLSFFNFYVFVLFF